MSAADEPRAVSGAVKWPPIPDPLVSLIIPIYNERVLIAEVLRRVRALPFRKQLVLVDDGSSDGTMEYLKEHEANQPDAVLVHHARNQGKGMAIRTGLRHATGEIILVQDADLEYDPAELPKLIAPIAEGRAAVVYGSRFLGVVRKMKLPNRVANWLLAAIVSVLYGQRLTDEATAYKVFRREVILEIPLTCERFEFCPEVTAKVLRRKYHILELPVSFTARTWEEGKKIGWRDFITALRVLIGNRF